MRGLQKKSIILWVLLLGAGLFSACGTAKRSDSQAAPHAWDKLLSGAAIPPVTQISLRPLNSRRALSVAPDSSSKQAPVIPDAKTATSSAGPAKSEFTTTQAPVGNPSQPSLSTLQDGEPVFANNAVVSEPSFLSNSQKNNAVTASMNTSGVPSNQESASGSTSAYSSTGAVVPRRSVASGNGIAKPSLGASANVPSVSAAAPSLETATRSTSEASNHVAKTKLPVGSEELKEPAAAGRSTQVFALRSPSGVPDPALGSELGEDMSNPVPYSNKTKGVPPSDPKKELLPNLRVAALTDGTLEAPSQMIPMSPEEAMKLAAKILQYSLGFSTEGMKFLNTMDFPPKETLENVATLRITGPNSDYIECTSTCPKTFIRIVDFGLVGNYSWGKDLDFGDFIGNVLVKGVIDETAVPSVKYYDAPVGESFQVALPRLSFEKGRVYIFLLVLDKTLHPANAPVTVAASDGAGWQSFKEFLASDRIAVAKIMRATELIYVPMIIEKKSP